MSHFVTIRTQIREREQLIEALRRLNLNFTQLSVRGDTGNQKAEVVIDTGTDKDIGLRQENGEFVIVADWYNIELGSSFRRNDFVRKLKQAYSYCVVYSQAQEQNLIVEEETEEDGNIVIVLSERG
jgi:hypothetical protein